MQMMQADRVPGLLPDDEYFSEGFSAYAVNFAESCEVDKLQQETKTDDREDVYRSILKGKVCIKDIGSLLLPRADTDPQRWVAISGRSGYGSGTLGQYLSYLWYIGGQLKIGNASLADTSLLGSLALKSARQLRGRYDLVLRVPCRMMGDSSVWTSAGEQTPSGYLAHLIQLSLGGISTARQRDLLLALTTHDDRTLVILDGFDEVRFLYGADAVVTAVIDRVMASGNGIIITKAGTMPSCWQQCGIHRITESIELIGFGREDARQYVKAYFAGRPNRAVSEAILAELDKNESEKRLFRHL